MGIDFPVAVIDLGSNLTKLVVVDSLNPLRVTHRSIYNTKTLKSAPKGFFDAASISRIEKDIETILSQTTELQAKTVLGIATSAFRTRENGEEVINHINKKYHTQIEIISGNTEADLIYTGCINSVKISQYPVLIMDIGGGSTEFIIANETGILWKHSFDFGSSALVLNAIVDDPISPINIHGIEEELTSKTPSLFQAISDHQPVTFIGTTGAFESFAQILSERNGNSSPVQSGFPFELGNLELLLDEIIELPSAERRNLRGMNKLRYETIHIAAIVFKFVLQRTNLEAFYLSLADVKEGLVISKNAESQFLSE